MKALEHFKTITYHKFLVMQGCFKVGLYYQGIMHDMSKYMPSEFVVGAVYYQGNRSPNNAEREAIGYSSAWLHHKGRNKHHFEYWIDYSAVEIKGGMAPAPMPVRYVIEMFMDRVAASKVYEKENYDDTKPLSYFMRGKDCMMHEKTKRQLMILLRMLARDGEKKTYSYIRHVILKRQKK